MSALIPYLKKCYKHWRWLFIKCQEIIFLIALSPSVSRYLSLRICFFLNCKQSRLTSQPAPANISCCYNTATLWSKVLLQSLDHLHGKSHPTKPTLVVQTTCAYCSDLNQSPAVSTQSTHLSPIYPSFDFTCPPFPYSGLYFNAVVVQLDSESSPQQPVEIPKHNTLNRTRRNKRIR